MSAYKCMYVVTKIEKEDKKVAVKVKMYVKIRKNTSEAVGSRGTGEKGRG